MEWLGLGQLTFSLPPGTIAVRLAAAALMGAVIGIDREALNRPAGLRTHMLVSLAAGLFTVLTLELEAQFSATAPESTTDPMRIIEAITAGVAFLAAGAIIQSRGDVRGLTTGAGLWLAGAIGLACGAGHYALAGMALTLAMIILVALRPVASLFRRDEPEGESDRSHAKARD